MAITIPNRKLVKPTTTPLALPGVPSAAMVNPYPVRVKATGAAAAGNPLVERMTTGTYYGFNLRTDIPNDPDNEGAAVNRMFVCDGFAGVVPGTEVWADPTATPNPDGTFSGLTQTDPANGTKPIGLGVTTTKIFFY